MKRDLLHSSHQHDRQIQSRLELSHFMRGRRDQERVSLIKRTRKPESRANVIGPHYSGAQGSTLRKHNRHALPYDQVGIDALDAEPASRNIACKCLDCSPAGPQQHRHLNSAAAGTATLRPIGYFDTAISSNAWPIPSPSACQQRGKPIHFPGKKFWSARPQARMEVAQKWAATVAEGAPRVPKDLEACRLWRVARRRCGDVAFSQVANASQPLSKLLCTQCKVEVDVGQNQIVATPIEPVGIGWKIVNDRTELHFWDRALAMRIDNTCADRGQARDGVQIGTKATHCVQPISARCLNGLRNSRATRVHRAIQFGGWIMHHLDNTFLSHHSA